MANMRLSVGLRSSWSISLTISFFYYNCQSKVCTYGEKKNHLGEPSELIVDCTNGLLYRFLKCSSDAHHFTNALHAAAQELAHAVELFKIPARNLNDNIVKTRFEARARHLRHRILDLVQGDAEPEFGRDEG